MSLEILTSCQGPEGHCWGKKIVMVRTAENSMKPVIGWIWPQKPFISCALFVLTYPVNRWSRFNSVGRASGSQIFWEHEFKSWQPHLCNSMWGQDRLSAERQEVCKCSTRGGSRGTYITFHSTMRIRQPTLALTPTGDVTRNPKQGCQWPHKWTCVRHFLHC